MQNLTLSITQLNNYIKNIFDNEELLIGVSVYGEVTNFKISNGIAYFDIKEDGAQLSCVKFSAYAPFAKNGDQVIVTGKLNYHVRLGRLSFVASKVEPYGMGELYKKYLELKARLESEGLFDESKKKELPHYARKIGVVTSETGAVIRDIYHVTKKKNPFTDILVYPAKVQGVGAENEIAEGIEFLDKNSDVDVIIVARGGGSFEDLAPFNTEKVARAIFSANKPVISAVGHETDFSISDFASDFRAPTPSVAAEVAVFDYYEELQCLEDKRERLKRTMQRLIEQNVKNVETQVSQIVLNVSNFVNVERKMLENKIDSIVNKVENIVENKNKNLNILVAKLEKSNPLTILKSGYSKLEKDGKIVSSVKNVSVGQTILNSLSDGEIESTITFIKEKTR